jgi:hypothetical protein
MLVSMRSMQRALARRSVSSAARMPVTTGRREL